MKVLIVDDSDLLRGHLAAMIGSVPGVRHVEQADCVRSALTCLASFRPDVAVLDIQLPDGNGIEVLKAIRKDMPLTHVIMLTNHAFPQYRKKCMAEGAAYFLDKHTEFETVVEVLEQMVAVH